VQELMKTESFKASSAHRWLLTPLSSDGLAQEDGPGMGARRPVEWARRHLHMSQPLVKCSTLNDIKAGTGTFADQLSRLGQTLMRVLAVRTLILVDTQQQLGGYALCMHSEVEHLL
jgi:hypothetical protein